MVFIKLVISSGIILKIIVFDNQCNLFADLLDSLSSLYFLRHMLLQCILMLETFSLLYTLDRYF